MLQSVTVIAASVMLIRAGVMHARHPDRLRSALGEQGLWATPMRPVIVIALPLVEMAVGTLALGAEAGLMPSAATALVLGAVALGFITVIGALLARRSSAPCGCGADDGPVHLAALLRPGLLIAGALILTLDGLPRDRPVEEILLAATAGVAVAVLVDLVVVTASVPRVAGGR